MPGRLADGAASKGHLHQTGPTLSSTHVTRVACGTPFMRQQCTPLPRKQPQVNVLDLCFCIKDVISNANEKVFFGKQNTGQYKMLDTCIM